MLRVCSKENLRLGPEGTPATLPTPAAARITSRHCSNRQAFDPVRNLERGRHVELKPPPPLDRVHGDRRPAGTGFLALPGNSSNRKAV